MDGDVDEQRAKPLPELMIEETRLEQTRLEENKKVFMPSFDAY